MNHFQTKSILKIVDTITFEINIKKILNKIIWLRKRIIEQYIKLKYVYYTIKL